MGNTTMNTKDSEVNSNLTPRTIDDYQRGIEEAALVVIEWNIKYKNTTINDVLLIKTIFSSMVKRTLTANEFYKLSKSLLSALELLAEGLINRTRSNVDSMIAIVEISSEIVRVMKSKEAWLAGVPDQDKKESAATNDASIVKNDLDKLDDNTPYTIVYE
ncbi:MAG TPA: hypothetical protein DCQ90_06565 [Erysipelotrichaceae bacterium]|nr:hypothetical protein [Erysipelotrichaceae bacterium]